MSKQHTVLKLNQFKQPKNAAPDFYIRTFQEHKKEHPFVMKPHAHDFYLIMLFTKGSGKHSIDFNEYVVKRGAVFFMSPAETHSWDLSKETDGYVLFFNPAFYLMDALPRQIKHLPFFNPEHKLNFGQLKNEHIATIEKIIKHMDAENKDTSSFKKNILRSYLDILLYKLAHLLQTKNVPATELNPVPSLLLLIEENYKAHKPVSFYAEKLHMSTQKLSAICSDQLNKTVHLLLQDRLLTEAKRLLAYSSLSISEIAYQLNFNDNSYFNRFFKRVEGITPEQFRTKTKVP